MKRNQNLALEVDAATPRVEALKEQVAKLSDKPETTDEQSEQIEKLETNLERDRLLNQWQGKLAQAKTLSQSGKPRAQIDPQISQLNAEANGIWSQIQNLKT